MPTTKVSIKLPSLVSLKKRLAGLERLSKIVLAQRPEPFHKSWKGGKIVPGKRNTPEGKEWREIYGAVRVLELETIDLIESIQALKPGQTGS